MKTETAPQSYTPVRVWIAFAALVAALTLVVSLGYGGAAGLAVRVGVPGDGLYVRDFYADEARSFRWAKGDSTLVFDDLPTGALHNATVSLTLAAPPVAAANVPPVTVLLNGVSLGSVTPKPNTLAVYTFAAPNVPDAAHATLELQSTPVSVPGDSRKLGPRVTRADLRFGDVARIGPFELPPFGALAWTWVLAAGLFLLVRRVANLTPKRAVAHSEASPSLQGKELKKERRAQDITPPSRVGRGAGAAGGAFAVGAIILGVPLLSNPLNPLWYAPLLLWAAVAVWAVYALLTLPRWVQMLADVPGYLDNAVLTLRGRRVALADVVMAGILAVYAVFALAVVFAVPFVGHADYADNAVVARNLVAGRGYTVDYAAQFYTRYPSGVSHAADTWPLLQPTLIAPFFALFGPMVWAAKLPNVILMLLLGWAVYRGGRGFVGRAAAILAAVLILATPLFFDTIAYPINDLAFTLFLWLGATTIYRAIERPPVQGATSETITDRRAVEGAPTLGQRVWRAFHGVVGSPYVQGGLWLGLLMLTKPSGAIPAAAILCWALLRRATLLRRMTYGRLRGVLVAGAVAALVLSPYLVRNEIQFGSPLYSTESHDAFVIGYGTAWENIYNLYAPAFPNTPPLPSSADISADGLTTKIATQWRNITGDLGDGTLANPFLLTLAAIGAALGVRVAGQKQRTWAFAALFLTMFAVTTLFFLTYWHYESRYFQPFLPWLYLFACGGLVKGAAIVRAWLQTSARQEHWALNALAPAAFAILLIPLVFGTFGHLNPAVTPSGPVLVADWMRGHLPASAVVLTRNPWEMTFHSALKTVMIPNNATLEQIRAVAKDYGAAYIELDHIRDDSLWGQRRALAPLLASDPTVRGFTKIYDTGGKDPFLIYAIQ